MFHFTRPLTLWVEICGEAVGAHLVWGRYFTSPWLCCCESGEVDQSGMAEGSGTINKFEIVESAEAHFGEFEEIS